MEGVQDLLINITAAVIVFVAGVGTRGLVGLIRSWRGRAFWGRSLLRGQTNLFIGAFPRFYHLEPSNFIGLGDSRAVHEVTTMLGKLGSSPKIAYASHYSDEQVRENLILLGFDEVNSLTPSVLEKVGSGFRASSKTMTIEDRKSGEIYSAVWQECDTVKDFDQNWSIARGPEGVPTPRSFRYDYGVLIRTQNPYAPERTLFVMAGIYGFGTWAAAQLPRDSEFLRLTRQYRNFECLIRVEVNQQRPLASSIIVLRPLPAVAPPLSGPKPERLDEGDRSAPLAQCEPAGSAPPATADDSSVR